MINKGYTVNGNEHNIEKYTLLGDPADSVLPLNFFSLFWGY